MCVICTFVIKTPNNIQHSTGGRPTGAAEVRLLSSSRLQRWEPTAAPPGGPPPPTALGSEFTSHTTSASADLTLLRLAGWHPAAPALSEGLWLWGTEVSGTEASLRVHAGRLC